ncbi:MAG: BPTI/Kunitz domain-containing protein [Candidatus Pacebacteria bacterium]|nr:BPTI/Kunitz domain-containing protein [Candidatus Paceibacterota bacterium]
MRPYHFGPERRACRGFLSSGCEGNPNRESIASSRLQSAAPAFFKIRSLRRHWCKSPRHIIR